MLWEQVQTGGVSLLEASGLPGRFFQDRGFSRKEVFPVASGASRVSQPGWNREGGEDHLGAPGWHTLGQSILFNKAFCC
jgi:hypothetical protein